MNIEQVFTSTWNWTSPAWIASAAVLAAYFVVFRRSEGRRPLPLVAGLAAFLLAYVSPIGTLADGYLFSAHMVQHLLLLLVVPMCLLLSLPQDTFTAWRDRSGARSRWLSRVANLTPWPLFAWLCGLGAMWFWHVPTLCAASTVSPALGALRDATFLAAGLAFWWPIYGPIVQHRLAVPYAVVYLFSACVGCTLLGIYITFTTISVCPVFASPVDRLNLLPAFHDAGFTTAVDQQVGGLLMWVPPCSLYVAAILSMLRRWYAVVDEETGSTGSLRPVERGT